MTSEELIKKYNREIYEAKDKKMVTSKIVNRIVRLKYENGKDISNEEKIRILTEIKKDILKESKENYAQDNTSHLEIIDLTISKLKGGK